MSTTNGTIASPARGVEFVHAISYVERIKNRYYNKGQPQIYADFLHILQAYRTGRRTVNDVHESLVTLFHDEPDLAQDFQLFLPARDPKHQGETYLDTSKLEGLSSIAFIANATISQDETGGRFERVLQGLQAYNEVLGARRPALGDVSEDLPPAANPVVNVESHDEIAAKVPSVSQAKFEEQAPGDDPRTHSEGSTEGIDDNDDLDDNDDDEDDDEENDVDDEDNLSRLDKKRENIEDKNKYGGTESQNSDIEYEDGPHKMSDDMFFPPRGIRDISAFASNTSNKKSGRNFSFGDEHSFTSEDPHSSSTQEQLNQESLFPQPRETKKITQMSLPDSGNESTKLQAGKLDNGDSREELLERLQELRNSNDMLLKENRRLLASALPTLPFLQLYRVRCSYDYTHMIFLDPPVHNPGNNHQHLGGHITIANLKGYLEAQSHFPFLIFKDYECDYQDPKRLTKLSEKELKSVGPTILQESFRILSKDLCSVLKSIIESEPEERFPVFDINKEIESPYFFYYHNRTFFKDHEKKLTESLKDVKVLLDYIQESVKEEYDEVDAMLARGQITAQYLPYLFAPTKVLVTSHKGQMQGYTQTSLLERYPSSERDARKVIWNLYAVSWLFDGSFHKSTSRLHVAYANGAAAESMDIKDLDVYPLQYAAPGTESLLRSRGEKFWSCRDQKYVSYTGQSWKQEESFTNMRFMIDIPAYYKMHPKAQRLVGNDNDNDKLSDEDMSKNQPPAGDFLLLLPANIFGFHMQEKRWVNLHINCIREVDWNDESFKSLVVDNDTKELIIALVTNKLEAERATDLMAGKGSGLIILLHGGPGTGKTLTAESVAEIAKKPLYRVTCGDIGTNPADVEKYLETVLNIGKMWKCVVLLDEADVFLEQRTLQDLQRNALVSVFLRVLEYYDGILILTSNRVATFDEAFKSRIQLALHYQNLNESQRRKIWQNFIERLESMEGENVDTGNLYKHVKELAKLDMNGREIRNALTTARQLAMHKQQKMDIVHMKHVIKVAGKFESYLNDVSGGVTDDEVARELGYR